MPTRTMQKGLKISGTGELEKLEQLIRLSCFNKDIDDKWTSFAIGADCIWVVNNAAEIALTGTVKDANVNYDGHRTFFEEHLCNGTPYLSFTLNSGGKEIPCETERNITDKESLYNLKDYLQDAKTVTVTGKLKLYWRILGGGPDVQSSIYIDNIGTGITNVEKKDAAEAR